MHAPHKGAFEFGGYRLDVDDRVLARGSEVIRLTPKAFDTLVLLVRRRGHLVGKDELIETLWPDAHVEENNLAQYISLLRRALADDVNGQSFIETVPRAGYRFVAAVHEVTGPAEPVTDHGQSAEAPSANAEIQQTSANAPSRPVPNRRARTSRWRVAATAVIAAGAVVAFVPLRLGTIFSKPVASVAILPLEADSNDGGTTSARLTLASDLIDRLARADEGRVLPLSSGYRFVGTAVAPREAGQQLHADAVLTGRLARRSAAGMNVSLSLVRTADGIVLWSDAFDVSTDHLGDVAARVTTGVARALSWQPVPTLSGAARSFEAREAYVMGRYLWTRRAPEALFQSTTLLERAVALSPEDPRVHVALAEAYAFDLANWSKAETEARAALQLDPTLGEPHASMGFVQLFWRRNWAVAEAEFKTAIRLSPMYATAHEWRAAELASQGDLAGAAAEIGDAHRLDPYSAPILADQCQIEYLTRTFDRGLATCREAIRADPDLLSAHVSELAIYEQTARGSEAVEEYARICAMTGRAPCPIMGPGTDDLRRSFEVGGLPAFWKAEIRMLTADSWASQLRLARDYARLGNNDGAIESLNRLAVSADLDALFVWADPAFDGLRGDPRFTAVFERVLAPRLGPTTAAAPRKATRTDPAR